MATNNSLKKQLTVRQEKNLKSVPDNSIKTFLKSELAEETFEELLKERAPHYISLILDIVEKQQELKSCEPCSVVTACTTSLALNLPADKNLGYAWIAPRRERATFQLGFKGYIQLALRTGKYRAMNVIEVHEGELAVWNPLTEELTIDLEGRISDAVVGYAGYFELLEGFRKSIYWPKEQIEKHIKKLGKCELGLEQDFDGLAKKLVIKDMLSKWGALSVGMLRAFSEELILEDSIYPLAVSEAENLGLVSEEAKGQTKEAEKASIN
jgi:recombination protein RecT